MRKSPFSSVNMAWRVRVLEPLCEAARDSGTPLPVMLRRAVNHHLEQRQGNATLATWRRAMALLSHETDLADI